MSANEETHLKRPKYFLWTAFIVGILATIAVVEPNLFTDTFTNISKFFYMKFDWLIMWLPLLAFTVCMVVALSPRFGNIRLGGKDAKPEYSFFSWMNMLFTAGIGVGIVFFGPIEALWHYYHSPIGIQAENLPEYQKVENAMSLALHVWGIPAWSLYTVGGLVLAYFMYQHKTECTPSAPLEYAFKHKKWAKPLGIAITGIAIISIAMSVSSSIAMASTQISSGLKIITGINFSTIGWQTVVLIIIAFLYTLGAVLPIEKGMKWLGDLTVVLSLLMLVFVFLVGPTHYFLSNFIVSIGNILTQTVHHSFELYLFHNRDWLVWYPMAYWVWWITWTPFVGVFLAQISKGRTLREFVLASIMVPVGFLVIWFSVFSGFSLLDTVEGTGRLAEIANKGDYEGTFYYLLNMLPLSFATKPLTVVLFLGFVVTTVTSSAISLGIMTSNDGRHENKTRAVIWSVLMSLISYAVIKNGAIESIKAVGSFSGFPFVFIMYLWFAALWRQLKRDVPRVSPVVQEPVKNKE